MALAQKLCITFSLIFRLSFLVLQHFACDNAGRFQTDSKDPRILVPVLTYIHVVILTPEDDCQDNALCLFVCLSVCQSGCVTQKL